jgi:hypothetical protein
VIDDLLVGCKGENFCPKRAVPHLMTFDKENSAAHDASKEMQGIRLKTMEQGTALSSALVVQRLPSAVLRAKAESGRSRDVMEAD